MDHERRRARKFGHGSVISLRLKDFMQFSNMVEFRPGPQLNVIVGPNGCGKSSLVNGIGLALGSKTSVLGRADHTADFIRTGCEQAFLEIQLYNSLEPDNNYYIQRIIRRCGIFSNVFKYHTHNLLFYPMLLA